MRSIRAAYDKDFHETIKWVSRWQIAKENKENKYKLKCSVNSLKDVYVVLKHMS